MLDFIAGIFKYPMMWFYSWTGSYLVALILYALLVKVIFLPISIHQQKMQIKGAKLRPKIALIEKKYRGRTDRDAMMAKQQEISELQQQEGYSMMSGCLPLLLQMPILLGLYQVIRKPLSYMLDLGEDAVTRICEIVNTATGTTFAATDAEQITLLNTLRQNPGIDISSVTASPMPDLTLFNGAINLGETPTFGWNWLILVPILTYALAYLQMKVTRRLNSPQMAANDSPEMRASNRMMDITMPLMGLFIAFTVPAAVGVYWLMGYVFGMLQTVILSKLMPLPTFTEQEIRQYEKEMKAAKYGNNLSRHGNGQASYETDENGGRVYQGNIRSLHHIDDDDDEPVRRPLPSAGKPQNAAPAKGKGKHDAAPSGNSPIAKAPLKEETPAPTDDDPSK